MLEMFCWKNNTYRLWIWDPIFSRSGRDCPWRRGKCHPWIWLPAPYRCARSTYAIYLKNKTKLLYEKKRGSRELHTKIANKTSSHDRGIFRETGHAKKKTRGWHTQLPPFTLNRDSSCVVVFWIPHIVQRWTRILINTIKKKFFHEI